MADLYAPGERVEYTPPGQEKTAKAKRLSYYLRAPSYIDRARVKRAVIAQGGRFVRAAEQAQVLRDGIRQIYEQAGDPDEGERLVAVLDEHQAAREAAAVQALAGPMTQDSLMETAESLPEPSPELLEVVRIVERHYPPYARLRADAEFLEELMGYESLRLLLLGDSKSGDYPRDGESVAAAAMERINADHVLGLTHRAMRLFQPSEEDKKKSD